MEQQMTTILIVDDEPHVIHVVGLTLRQGGYNVITANSGRAAFELALEHMPSLIVTDFQMPGGSGLELAERLCGNPKTAMIPVVMLSARGYRASREALSRTNVRALLAKPFSPRNLRKKIDELLSGGVEAEAA